MPITQDRMLSLISAAQAYRAALAQCVNDLALIQSGQLPIAVAIIQYRDRQMAVAERHLEVIAREDAHFAAWQGKNYRNAKRRADKRRQEAPKVDWQSAAQTANMSNKPSLQELEKEINEWLELENQLQSQANPLETLDKTNSEQAGNKR